jgi:hypothetical protein
MPLVFCIPPHLLNCYAAIYYIYLLYLAVLSIEPTSFFSAECDKVFVSTLSENKYYRKIIDFLANRKFADQKGIYRAVIPGKINSKKGHPGGSFTLLLDDLESLGFISKYRSIPNKTLPAWPVIAYQMNTCIFISNSSNPKFKLLIAENI